MGNESVTIRFGTPDDNMGIPGIRVAFSAHQCFRFDEGPEDLRCLAALGTFLLGLPAPAMYGDGPLVDYLLRHVPALRGHLVCRISDAAPGSSAEALPRVHADALPAQVSHVFLCETLTFTRMQMRKRLPAGVAIIEPEVLCQVCPQAVPDRAWVSLEQNIYPIDIPEIEFRPGMDLLLIDCPSRNLSMMPNGLGYVHNALKKTGIRFQTLDLDIITYHRYHIHRLYDMGGTIVLPDGSEAPTDPWLAENYDFWAMAPGKSIERNARSAVLEFFSPLIDEIVSAIVRARPRIIGLSIQQCNEAFSRQVVNGVRAQLPEVIVIVGGYSCYNPDIGRRAFPECDYMFVGEADLTVGPMVEALARGERPINQPGVLSRFDTPDYQYLPGPVPHNIDKIEFPKYEWFDDLSIYQNYNGYQLTPIIASRGCRWSRCTFCAERFYWRIRSAPNFVDELQWLTDQGCHLFMFNESDLNGMPEKLLEICDEVISRGLHRKAKLTGQLRIHKKSTRAFFDRLRAANVVALRFGVDAFSDNTLRLQKKGYTTEMVSQNLRDCWESGIYTEVNWVIGVPGEREEDIDEGIQLILQNKNYIGRLANINPLIMVNGSVYWIDPDAFNIVFREPREKLYYDYPRAMPADKWYSTEPYIDARVRKERFEKIVLSLYDAGFPVGSWANRVIEDVKLARDSMRSVAAAEASQPATEAAVPQASAPTTPQAAPEAAPPAAQASPASPPPQDATPATAAATAATTSTVATPAAASAPRKIVEISATREKPLSAEAPRQFGSTASHRLVHYLGGYYAIPLALGEVDLTTCDMSAQTAIIRATSEQELRQMLEEADAWANSRGHYTAQKRQREQGTYYQAGSFCGAPASRPLEFSPHIIEHEGQRYAVRHADWQAHQPAAGQTTKPRVLGIISTGATPDPLWTIGTYNIVKFDAMYYAIPQGRPIDWDCGTVAAIPGVLCARSLRQLNSELATLSELQPAGRPTPSRKPPAPPAAAARQRSTSKPRICSAASTPTTSSPTKAGFMAYPSPSGQ